MPSYSVTLLAIIALAVIGLAAWLYMSTWRNPSRVKICKFDPEQHSYEENHDCYLACGPRFKPGTGPVQATINGKTWLYCCPEGYTAHVTPTEEYCKKY